MKKVIIMFALAMGIVTANAQENVTVGKDNGSEQPTLTKEVYPQKEADGDLYHGLTKKLTFDRMIPPHGLEVTYDKTVHVIFPAEVRYVDLGSPDLIAGKADGADLGVAFDGDADRCLAVDGEGNMVNGDQIKIGRAHV